jgi:hypothetical protein
VTEEVRLVYRHNSDESFLVRPFSAIIRLSQCRTP